MFLGQYFRLITFSKCGAVTEFKAKDFNDDRKNISDFRMGSCGL